MNLLAENKKQYFFVMITEFIVLSYIYWHFFNFKFSSLLVYILSVGFYITMYRVWLKIFERKEHLLFYPTERFSVIGIIFLSVILAVNAGINSTVFTNIFCACTIISFIFVFYYIFRRQKQKGSFVPVVKFSTASKIITCMCGIFLLFDLIVSVLGKLSLQLVLYIPFLFLILSFIVCVYKKTFKFNSFSSLILFFNIYIMATLLLVLNYINFNFFSFTIIIHFIIFSAAVFVMMENSIEKDDNYLTYSLEIMALIFLNIVLIFISLNNILSMQIPDIFTSYLHFVSILFICYLGIRNYKLL